MANDGRNPADRLEAVFSDSDLVRLGIARDYLENAGLDAFIFDATFSQLYGTAVPARLMVYADCAAEARERLCELGFLDQAPAPRRK
jgi:hypothetical protein